MKKRERKEENGVPLDYIKLVHQCYESWLVHKNVHKPPAPVLIIDADQTEEELIMLYEENRNKIIGRSTI